MHRFSCGRGYKRHVEMSSTRHVGYLHTAVLTLAMFYVLSPFCLAGKHGWFTLKGMHGYFRWTLDVVTLILLVSITLMLAKK